MAIPANVLAVLEAMLTSAQADYEVLCAGKTTQTCEYMEFGIVTLASLIAALSATSPSMNEQQWSDTLAAVNAKVIAMKPPAVKD